MCVSCYIRVQSEQNRPSTLEHGKRRSPNMARHTWIANRMPACLATSCFQVSKVWVRNIQVDAMNFLAFSYSHVAV